MIFMNLTISKETKAENLMNDFNLNPSNDEIILVLS